MPSIPRHPSRLRGLFHAARGPGLAAVLAALLSACGGGATDAVVSGAATPAASAADGATVAVTEATASARALAVPPSAPPAPPVALSVAPPPAAGAGDPDRLLTPLQRLGKRLFTDPNLSEPAGTSCQACHSPALGFAGNHGSRIGVAQGSRPGVFGFRNAMSNAYTAFIPPFGFSGEGAEFEAVGGLFWDGRADTPAQQALGPLLAAAEMNNPSAQAVIDKIAASAYAPLFRQVFGARALAQTDTAFVQVGQAIAAYEASASLQPFTAKYDAVLRGQARFSPAESRGMALFQDASRANCAGCHRMNPASARPEDSLFTEFTYYATGIPRNRAIPANADPGFFDLGLCGPSRARPVLPAQAPAGLGAEAFCGKFRMPSLRNVAQRAAYMHNGVFQDLREVLRFYATRDSDPQRWYGPAAVPNDLPVAYQGNVERSKAPFNRSAAAGPLLSEAEIDDLLAFLHTLSDGFSAP